MTDIEIIDLYWQRNHDAIEQSEKKYGSYCNSIASSILKNHEDAEECTNDTWLKAWGAMPPQRPDVLRLFFGRITRNLAFNRYKKDRALKRGGGAFSLVLNELDDCVPSAFSVEQAVSDSELEQLVNRFLHSLPERECNVFLLRYWYNLPLKKIAKQLQAKESNIKGRLFRTRQKLKAFLEKEGVQI